MRSIIPLLTLVAVCGCASAGASSDDPSRTSTTRVIGTGSSLELSRNVVPSAHSTTHAAAGVEDVWKELPEVYRALEIPFGTVVTAEHRIGNEALRLRRKLGNMSLTRVVDCGGTPGAPNAESYEVTLYVTSRVAQPPSGSGAVLSTVVEATARPVNFAGDAVPCTSLGGIERRIDELVRARLALAGKG